jgi:GNAT superfamily N-acetyltransferase
MRGTLSSLATIQLGRAGLYLEDLFVPQQFRGRGIGIGLLAAVAQIALQENCCAMRWEVLNWNEKAIDLYKALGAEFSQAMAVGSSCRRSTKAIGREKTAMKNGSSRQS